MTPATGRTGALTALVAGPLTMVVEDHGGRGGQCPLHVNAQGCICSGIAALACAERRPHACALLHELLQGAHWSQGLARYALNSS